MRLLTFEFDLANPTPNDFCQVTTMKANGDNVTVLPLANGDACEAAPTFSADGTRIFYEGYNGKRRDDIYSMNLDGSDRRLITACQGTGVTSPEASPDGAMLAFTCTSRTGSALFVSSVNGSHPRQLTPYSMQVGFHEDWSPDSRRIVFITIPNEGTPTAQINTWTIGADGSGLVQLTTYPAGGLRAYGNSYSPDGRLIVMRIEKDDGSGGSQSALFTIPVGGGTPTQMTAYSDLRPRGMVWGSECPCTS
jgi:Tol biopolymer transport system component